MTKIYVRTAAISATHNTPIIHREENDDAVEPNFGLKESVTRFCFPNGKHVVQEDMVTFVLAPSWRDDLPFVVNKEAETRILRAFPAYAQRNAVAETTKFIRLYGTTLGGWPVEAQEAQKEIDRGWTYVQNVRAATDAILSKGVLNPCDPNLWPAEAPVVKMEVI